jgi:hypothetical protein
VTLQGSYPLVPGDTSYPTLTATTTALTPSDGSPLTLAFPNVASVASAGTSTGSVIVALQGSTVVDDTSTAPVASGLLPDGTSAPVGSIAYSVQDVPVGGSVDVYVQLPAGADPTAIYKLQNGQLVDVSSLATISGNTVTLHLTDGGLGDADGVANGVIVDPLIPVVGTPVAPTITKVAPTSGPVGTVVTLKGTNLSGATKVTLNGVKASIITDTATKIKVKVPSGATSGKIKVTTAGGTVKAATPFAVSR